MASYHKTFTLLVDVGIRSWNQPLLSNDGNIDIQTTMFINSSILYTGIVSI